MLTNKVRVLILFLAYGNRYKGSFDKLLEICKQIKLEKQLIIIRNDLEDNSVRQINSWIFEIRGDNSVFEFSGWQKGVESEIARSFKPQVYLVANDAFLSTGAANSFYTLPVLDDEIIRIVYDKKVLGGHMRKIPFRVDYSGLDLSLYIQTHFFLIPAEIIEKLGSLVSESSSGKFLKPEYSPDIFRENEIWSKQFKKYVYSALTQRWHGKGMRLSPANYDFFKRKTLCVINERLLSARVRKLNYRIVDLTPFPNLCNSFYILNIPFRPILPSQFIRRIIFSIFYILFYKGYSKKMGIDRWFRKICISNVKNNLRRENNNNKPLRVLMLISRFYPLIGGSERQLFDLAKEMLRRKVKLLVVTERWQLDCKIFEVIDGIPVYRLSLVKPGWLRDISYIVLTFLFLYRKRREYDLIHTHSNVALGCLGTFIGKLLGKKVIVKIATAGKIPKLRKKFLGNILIEIFKKANSAVSISQEIKEELYSIKMADSKIKFIPNGVDTIKFNLISAENRKKMREKLQLPQYPLVLFVGRLVYRKGVDVLLRAWKSVITECREMHLLIAGSGFLQSDSTEKELKKFVIEQGLKSSVSFLGNIGNAHEYLQVSDMFVLPSRREGMPNVLLEAMSCGLPVIATEIGGITDLIIHNENGILCPVNNPELLAEKILTLKEDSIFAQKIGRNARRTVEEKFSLDRLCKDYLKLYSDLYAAGTGRQFKSS